MSSKKRKSKSGSNCAYEGILFCMYCQHGFFPKDMSVKEGRYDVCKSPECIEFYNKEKKTNARITKEEARKRSLEDNYPDSSWMTGETK